MTPVKTLIRIFDDMGESFPFENSDRYIELEEFGGCVPEVGDLILDTFSWRPRSKSRKTDFGDPKERRMWEVTRRYFLPEAHPTAGKWETMAA